MGNNKSALKYIGYLWTTLLNFFTIIVVVLLFQEAFTNYETIVLALLVLIYLSTSSFSAYYSYVKGKEIQYSENEFKKIRLLLEEKINDEEKEFEEDQTKEYAEKIKKVEIKFWINAAFNSVTYAIALYFLITSLY